MSNILDEFMDSEEFEKIIKEFSRRRKKYYWNDAIQSQDKSNNLNLERRKFNPNVMIESSKRIGINKRKARLSSDDCFNEMNN